MFGILFNLTSFLFFINIIAELISWLKLFDDKEYSFKRVFLHFKETKVGRSMVIGWPSVAKWLLIFAYVSTIFWNVDEWYHLSVFFLYLALSIVLLKKILVQSFAFPRITPNAITIFIAVMIVESSLFLFLPLDAYLWMLLINKLLFFLVCFFVWILSIFFDFLRDAKINRAISKISARPNLLTIAIVGSYGRGSTKEFLTKVLSVKYDVLEVDTAFNDAFGIAKVVNKKLKPSKQIFIAEMDDYKKGDISEMIGIVAPKIVIVCGINEQKISTFGNMEQVLSSKLEAINGLSKDGIALFNSTSEYNRTLLSQTQNKKFTYSTAGKADIAVTKIDEAKFHLTFDVKVLGKNYKLSRIKLLGRSNIENLLPAIFIAAYIGMDFSLIKKTLSSLKPLKSTMEPRINSKKTVLIDDTHNANINSVLRAISYVQLYKGKKIFVLEPLVELGRSSKEVHEMLAREIGKSCDYLFLTNDNQNKAIIKGVKKANSNCEVVLANPAKIAKFINENCSNEDVVVFEGKESARILSLINSKKVY